VRNKQLLANGKDLFPWQALRSSPALSDIWERPVPFTSPQVLSCSTRYLGKTCSLHKPSGPLLLYQISGKDLFPWQALRSSPALSDIWERPVPLTSPQVPSCSIRYLGKTCSLHKPSGPLLLYQIFGKDLFPSQALRSPPALSDIWERPVPLISPQVLSCSIRYLGKTCSLHKPSGPLLLYQISGKVRPLDYLSLGTKK